MQEQDPIPTEQEQRAATQRARERQYVLGRLAAFGRFAFTRSTPRTPRHADTWTDKGPHESTGACARRLRQQARQQAKRGAAIAERAIPY